MILPPRSHQFRVAGSPGYSLPVFRGGAHPVWGLTAIITLQVRHYHRILSHTNQYFIFKFIELNRFSLVSPRSPPRHRLSPSDPFPVTAQVMTKAVKLFCANFSVGTFQWELFSFSFRVFSVVFRFPGWGWRAAACSPGSSSTPPPSSQPRIGAYIMHRSVHL